MIEGGHGTRPALLRKSFFLSSLLFAFGPEAARGSTGASPHASALGDLTPRKLTRLVGPMSEVQRFSAWHFTASGSVPFHHNKKDSFRCLFLWRRTWDSNPRGVAALPDFQSGSLATRSILQVLSILISVIPDTLFNLT